METQTPPTGALTAEQTAALRAGNKSGRSTNGVPSLQELQEADARPLERTGHRSTYQSVEISKEDLKELTKSKDVAKQTAEAPAEVTSSPTVARKPDWVQDKFWNKEKGEVDTEALSKSYAELEKKLGKPADAPSGAKETPKDGKSTPEGTNTPTDKDNPVNPTGRLSEQDLTKYTNDFVKNNGKLSDESYAELEKAGFPKSIVDVYVQGLNAQKSNFENAVFAEVGGEAKFREVQEWARNTLDESTRKSIDAQFSTGDLTQAKMAAKFLEAKFNEANKTARSVTGKSASAPSSVEAKPISSKDELQKLMTSIEYRNDPAFREEVKQRLAVTDMTNLKRH